MNSFERPVEILLVADGTRSTQDVRRPWTKRSGDSQNCMAIRCAQLNGSRTAAWRRRRVTVARPVRIAFCTNLRFSSRFDTCPRSAKYPNLGTLNWALPQWSLCFVYNNGLTRASSCLQW